MLSGVTLRGPSVEQCGRQPRCILVHKQGWGVGSRGLQILHGIPLIDAALLGADAALIVGGPDERHPTREVVVPPCHFTGLVKHLEGRPGGGERSSGPGTCKGYTFMAVGWALGRDSLPTRQSGTTISSQRLCQLNSQRTGYPSSFPKK